MVYDKGHCQYIVECVPGESCMEVFSHPQIPKIGESHNGLIVLEMRAEMLSKTLCLVSLKVDPVK